MEENKVVTTTSNEPKEISLKELFEVVWKGKFIILIGAAIGLVLAGAVGLYLDKSTEQLTTLITLQWSGSTQGEYPDGTTFNYSEAVEPYVITRALDNLGILAEYPTSDVRASITLTPIVPNDVAALIQASLENGEEMTYHAVDYKISMDIGELGMDENTARELIYEIINEFKQDFDRRYISQQIVLDYTGTDFDEIDYVDIVDIFDTQADLITSIMNSKYVETPEFVSPTLSIGFNDILVRAELVKRIDIAQIEAKSNAYLLTKDSEYLITYYTYQVERKTFDLQELTQQETDIQFQIDNYNGSTQTILIPGIDPANVLEIDNAYDGLLKDMISVQAEIAAVQADIDYLELLISRYEDPTTIVSSVKQDEELAKVEALIITSDTKLSSIVSDANTILAEYNEFLTSNIIKPLMAPAMQSTVSVIMYAGIGLVLGTGIGGVVVLFKHDWN